MRPARAVLLLGLLTVACDARTPAANPSDPAPDCPACECACKDEAGADVGELMATASRKLHHGDGAGCLADLDAVARLDAKLDQRMAMLRGQCEMAAGRCQAGKQRVARWAEVETAMTPERAALTAEQLASMYCKGGDATDRDRLLAALFQLSDGAYANRRTPAFCSEQLRVARELSGRVKPIGPDDGQLAGGVQALFHTAAHCFARAGDCKQALAVYTELFPATTGLADPMARERVIAQSFEAAVVLCRDEPG